MLDSVNVLAPRQFHVNQPFQEQTAGLNDQVRRSGRHPPSTQLDLFQFTEGSLMSYIRLDY